MISNSKVVLSNNEPTNTNVLWLNYKGELYKFGSNGWEAISGASNDGIINDPDAALAIENLRNLLSSISGYIDETYFTAQQAASNIQSLREGLVMEVTLNDVVSNHSYSDPQRNYLLLHTTPSQYKEEHADPEYPYVSGETYWNNLTLQEKINVISFALNTYSKVLVFRKTEFEEDWVGIEIGLDTTVDNIDLSNNLITTIIIPFEYKIVKSKIDLLNNQMSGVVGTGKYEEVGGVLQYTPTLEEQINGYSCLVPSSVPGQSSTTKYVKSLQKQIQDMLEQIRDTESELSTLIEGLEERIGAIELHLNLN